MIAKQKGYAVRVIIPGEVAPSIGDLLELYGAEITWCEPRAGMKGAIDLALEMSQEDGFHYVGQFDNPMNLQTHYATTGTKSPAPSPPWMSSLPELAPAAPSPEWADACAKPTRT